MEYNTKENKNAILYSLLVKYDGLAQYEKFCNSLSNFIQSKSDGDDILNIYNHFMSVDREDVKKVNEAIGAEINDYLFTI